MGKMKRHIKFISIALATMLSLSVGAVSAKAATNPFNLNYAMGAIKDTQTPVLDENSRTLHQEQFYYRHQ